ncbi:MAG: hypothetical protein E7Z91_04945 [Cyanobacteria bacterium SIG30]|nr:hypothetical protein [Cyanobacteria bacterium SIG30]
MELEELQQKTKDFIQNLIAGNAKNEKDEEKEKVENEDKRKIIDEVGGILKDKVDEEVRTGKKHEQ